MISDLDRELRQSEQQLRSASIKPFEKGVEKGGPSIETKDYEFWTSPKIKIKNLGTMQAWTLTPRTKQALEADSIWEENQSVYVVDNNGEISFGRARDFMGNYGSLRVSVNAIDLIMQDLYSKEAFRKGDVPQVNVDCIIWFSENSKLRGKLAGILGGANVYEFGLEDSGEKDRPILIAPNESLLKKLNIAFETYTEPQGGAN